MTTKISVSITGYSDGSKIRHLFIKDSLGVERAIKITQKQANEIVKISGLKLKTDFGTPGGAKSYKFYI